MINNNLSAKGIIIFSIIGAVLVLIGAAAAGYFIGRRRGEAVFENGMMCGEAAIIFSLNVRNACSYKDVANALGVDEEIIEDLIREYIADETPNAMKDTAQEKNTNT